MVGLSVAMPVYVNVSMWFFHILGLRKYQKDMGGKN